MTELPWIAVARGLIGVREVTGPRSNSVIIGWPRHRHQIQRHASNQHGHMVGGRRA